MKIVNIIGGLGNQMLQYAFALRLSEMYPEENVLIDTSHFHYFFLKKWKTANIHNGYEIDDVFPNAHLKKASALQLIKLTWYIPNFILSRLARRYLPNRKTEYIQDKALYYAKSDEPYEIKHDCYYEGLYGGISNLLPSRPLIQKVYQHSTPNEINRKYIQEIQSSNSVGIHVRRGDYLQSQILANICNLEYYQKAIGEVLNDGKQHSFYIFTNDKEWCEKNITPLCQEHKFHIVTENTGKNSCWDMFLMSYCKDLIIANSSFSWWGAFLKRDGGRVITPNRWFDRDSEFDVWAPDWIRL